jgi:RNA polymerase sigma-70 factor, ECF subfamily
MEPTAKSDAELVAASLAGDHEAFGQLYNRHARTVRAVVIAISGDWSATDDMTQECFLRAYRKLSTLHDRQRFGPWIAGFARHVARERRRSLQRDRHEFGTEISELPNNSAPMESDDREEFEQVMLRVAGLPEDERLAIHTFFLADQNAAQAAQQLELSRSGFYALVQRALARLATHPHRPDSMTKAKP